MLSYRLYHDGVVFDHPASEVWEVVRDFNSYPLWVDGVDESHIEDGFSGTAVGAVRDFTMGGSHTRQRLLAHSEVDRYFTYGSCAPFELTSDGATRTLLQYEGTLRVTPIVDGDRSFVDWSANYRCPAGDAEHWAGWWAESLPEWLRSLRGHLDSKTS